MRFKKEILHFIHHLDAQCLLLLNLKVVVFWSQDLLFVLRNRWGWYFLVLLLPLQAFRLRLLLPRPWILLLLRPLSRGLGRFLLLEGVRNLLQLLMITQLRKDLCFVQLKWLVLIEFCFLLFDYLDFQFKYFLYFQLFDLFFQPSLLQILPFFLLTFLFIHFVQLHPLKVFNLQIIR